MKVGYQQLIIHDMLSRKHFIFILWWKHVKWASRLRPNYQRLACLKNYFRHAKENGTENFDFGHEAEGKIEVNCRADWLPAVPKTKTQMIASCNRWENSPWSRKFAETEKSRKLIYNSFSSPPSFSSFAALVFPAQLREVCFTIFQFSWWDVKTKGERRGRGVFTGWRVKWFNIQNAVCERESLINHGDGRQVQGGSKSQTQHSQSINFHLFFSLTIFKQRKIESLYKWCFVMNYLRKRFERIFVAARDACASNFSSKKLCIWKKLLLSQHKVG